MNTMRRVGYNASSYLSNRSCWIPYSSFLNLTQTELNLYLFLFKVMFDIIDYEIKSSKNNCIILSLNNIIPNSHSVLSQNQFHIESSNLVLATKLYNNNMKPISYHSLIQKSGIPNDTIIINHTRKIFCLIMITFLENNESAL